MMIPAETHISWFSEQWKWTSAEMPLFSNEYSPAEKLLREKKSTSFYSRFKSLGEEVRKGKREMDDRVIMPELSRFMTDVYDFPGNTSELVVNPEFFSVSRCFHRQAKDFDSSLKPEEIYQAMRNLWIMNGIQMMMGLPLELTPAMFAYSLLYPYSDNLLDDPGLSKSDKLMFSWRFEDRLRGIKVPARDHREQKISELVGMIEEQYNRDDHTDVYESLLAIHAAQTRSIVLQNQGDRSPEEILQVCFAKGGASVLADGFLVSPMLTPLQQRFLYGYGIWLQLSDDIQDIADDEKEQVRTLFAGAESREEVAEFLNRTIHFGRAIIHDIGCFPSATSSDFGRIMVHSIEMMILQSAALNQTYFPDSQLKQLERHSPQRFSYLREMKKKGTSRRMGLITSMASV
jgi:hypothetical protein